MVGGKKKSTVEVLPLSRVSFSPALQLYSSFFKIVSEANALCIFNHWFTILANNLILFVVQRSPN